MSININDQEPEFLGILMSNWGTPVTSTTLLSTMSLTAEINTSVDYITEVYPTLPAEMQEEVLDIALGSPEGLIRVTRQLKELLS